MKTTTGKPTKVQQNKEIKSGTIKLLKKATKVAIKQ